MLCYDPIEVRFYEGIHDLYRFNEADELWEYYKDDQQDAADTALGNSEHEQVTLGVYVQVEDEGRYVYATLTDEDNGYLRAYLVLMLISLAAVALLLWQRWKENDGKIFIKR